jgi:uracil-DNA glycosylase
VKGPGEVEDEKGKPFVGRPAGERLNNMIKDMGIERGQVYIANIVKCRPPNNRKPKREECEKCSPFLMQQIAVIKPKVIVALGATAAKRLLNTSSTVAQLRDGFHVFRPAGVRSNDPNWDGCKLKVTYHPASRRGEWRPKGEAWKDLQMVMKELGMKTPKTNP